MFANPRGLTISTVTYLEFQKPFRSKTLMSCVFRKWLWICFVNFSVKKPHFFKGHGIVSDGLAYTRLHDTAGCQTGCTTGLTTVLNEQPPFVQPVVKRVWQPVECLYTRYDWLSNRFDNRFDNMLYRVSGTLVVTALVYQSTKCITLCSAQLVYTELSDPVEGIPSWSVTSHLGQLKLPILCGMKNEYPPNGSGWEDNRRSDVTLAIQQLCMAYSPTYPTA